MILKVRGDSEQGDTSVRNRKKSTLNFDAVTLLKLIDWSNEHIVRVAFFFFILTLLILITFI